MVWLRTRRVRPDEKLVLGIVPTGDTECSEEKGVTV